MGQPTLSVTLTSYNYRQFIGTALGAILGQSFRPLEVVVVDDGSTDDSVVIIEKFARRDGVIRLLCNEKNQGPLAAFSTALKNTTGDYIYTASADDNILPGFFERSMNLLAQHPQAGLCCSDPVYFEDHTGTIRVKRLHLSERPCYFSPDAVLEVMRRRSFSIAGHTSIVKRSALLEAGGMIPELRWSCDWFALLVIAFRRGICYIPEPLAAFRVSPNSYSASGSRLWSTQREILKHMLCLLKSPAYRDVLPMFKHTGVLSIFRSRILRVLLSNPEHWDYLSPLLIRRVLWHEALGVPARVAPSWVRRIYRYVRDRRRENMALGKYRVMLAGEARESGARGHKRH